MCTVHRHTLFGSHVKLTRPVGKVDRDVRQAQRLSNGFNHHGQHIVRQHDRLHPGPETGQHSGRVVPVAVHQSVHSALRSVAQRRECQGGGGCSDRSGDGSRQAKPADQHRDQGRVPGDEDGDQGDIHQGSVGQPLDVEQPVSAQCDGEAHHERQPGQADRTRRQQLVSP